MSLTGEDFILSIFFKPQLDFCCKKNVFYELIHYVKTGKPAQAPHILHLHDFESADLSEKS